MKNMVSLHGQSLLVHEKMSSFVAWVINSISKKLSRISFYLSRWLRPSSKLVYKPWNKLHKNLHELVRYTNHKPNRSFSHNHGNLARYQTTTPSWFLWVLISITKPAARSALCRNDCPTLRRYHRQCFGCRLGGRTSSKKLLELVKNNIFIIPNLLNCWIVQQYNTLLDGAPQWCECWFINPINL